MRVVVLGPGGAGKSTFARALADASGTPLVELDAVYWRPNLRPRSLDEWAALQDRLTAPEAWVLDGDLGPYDVLAPRLRRADTVVLLDVPIAVCAWRALRRSRQRRDFWVWLLTWRRRSHPALLAAIAIHAPQAHLVVSRSRRPAATLLPRLVPAPPS